MAKNTKEVSGWLGWVGFASFMLLFGGAISLLAGFVALFKDGVVFTNFNESIWILNYTQWGWIHMLLGVLAILVAFSLASGNMLGRTLAVLVALVSAVANMAFIPIYPFWALSIVVIDILVVYAIVAHGGDLKE
ncbi:hypothetical protein KBC51_03260 [Candidatus Saccharibacteria bacterium]|nr:hypothetical protein [Candidatus Saccharibacteria bacterium]